MDLSTFKALQCVSKPMEVNAKYNIEYYNVCPDPLINSISRAVTYKSRYLQVSFERVLFVFSKIEIPFPSSNKIEFIYHNGNG